MILQVKDAAKSFGTQDLFKNLNLVINENEKIALIGANGAGKTTLFNIIREEETLDSGNVFWKSNIRKGFLDQIHLSNESQTVKSFFDEVFKDLRVLQSRLESLEKTMQNDHSQKVLESYDRVQTEFIRRGGYTIDVEVNTILTQFGFNRADLNRNLDTFSGGQITRLAFIRLLLSKPDILFLDEPTNHLDVSTIEWLEGYLNKYDGAVVVISHDRLFLDRVCNVVVELENGQATRYESNYSGYIPIKEKNTERHNMRFRNQQKEIERIETLIEKFRHKKSKAAFAQSKIKYLDRMDKIEKINNTSQEFKAEFKAKVRGGKVVLDVSDLEVGYERPLFKITQEFTRGKRYAIIGDNGTGKSTLLKTISGMMEPLNGEILLGHQIEIGYFDQQLLNFDMSKTILEEVWDAFPEIDHTQVRTVLSQFLFKGEEVFKNIAVLSGGERVRLALVKLMLRYDNLLILDEPTNHLDIQGKEALERALENYNGTMIFVSHDRYFVDKLATDTLLIKNGTIDHIDKSFGEIRQEEKTEIKVKKEENKLDYASVKKQKNRKQKIEGMLPQLYEDLESHRALRYDPEYYHDFEKMNDLDHDIDEIHNEIKHLEEEWMLLSLELEDSE